MTIADGDASIFPRLAGDSVMQITASSFR